jgi:hypothetical protein
MKSSVSSVRLSAPSLLLIVTVVGAAAYAAGRSMPSDPASTSVPSSPRPSPAQVSADRDNPSPPRPSEPRAGTATEMPPGHPSVDTTVPPGAAAGPRAGAQATLTWKAPARWELAPNASSMRIATYRVPHAAGDTVDAELSIVRAGGSVDANAERWVAQFDEAGQKTAKRSTRRVGGLDVAIVEVTGTYSGGMGMETEPASGWSLLGAIVPTPDTPHFFKLTGPAKSVAAARAEFEAFVASLAPKSLTPL